VGASAVSRSRNIQFVARHVPLQAASAAAVRPTVAAEAAPTIEQCDRF
jgi:hypothetical protein